MAITFMLYYNQSEQNVQAPNLLLCFYCSNITPLAGARLSPSYIYIPAVFSSFFFIITSEIKLPTPPRKVKNPELQHFIDTLPELLNAGRAPNTKKKYEAAWNKWDSTPRLMQMLHPFQRTHSTSRYTLIIF